MKRSGVCQGDASSNTNSTVITDGKIQTLYSTKLSDYEIGPVIGRSSFLSTLIYAGKFSKTNEFVAIKKYDVDAMSVDEIKILQSEINVSNQLKHSYLVTALTSFVVGTEIVVICQLMEYRSCADIITKHYHTGLPEIVIRLILKDILIALEFIHSKGIIHRAVKASHILIALGGQAKLCGFRYACQSCTKTSASKKIYEFPSNCEPNLKWLSPDILQQNRKGYDEKSDIYSLGVAVCELANGFVPYLNIKLSEMLLQKINGNSPFIYDQSTLDRLQDTSDHELVEIFKNYFSNREFSKHLHSFKDLCCIQNPEDRPDANKLLVHSLITKIDKNRKPFSELIAPAIPITEKCFSTCRVESQTCETSALQKSSSFNWEF